MIFLLIHLIFILKISNYFLYINFFNSSYNNFTKTILYEYYSNLNINIFFLKEISYSNNYNIKFQNFNKRIKNHYSYSIFLYLLYYLRS